jgi:hypothetical protein
MRPRSPSRLVVSLVALAWTAVAGASDTVSGSVFDTHYDAAPGPVIVVGAGNGNGESLAYQHSSDDGGVIIALNNTEFPVGALRFADLDAYRHEWEHVWISAGGTIGETSIPGAPSSTLYKVRVAVDTQFDPQWVTHLGDQFIDLDQIHGHLATTSVEYRPTPQWGVKLGGGYALSGTLADRYGQVGLNWYGVDNVYGGLILGRTGYDPSRLGEIAAVRREFQAYAGTALPLGTSPQHATLTLSADSLSIEGIARQTLRIGFIKPIRP